MLFGIGNPTAVFIVFMGVYFILIGITFGLIKAVPSGFVPAQDKQYLIGIAQLPDGASLERTTKVIREMSEIALQPPLKAKARFGLVTIANKAEAMVLPEIRRLMTEVLRERV